MNRRVWGIIIVIASLAIIAGIVYIIFFYKFAAPVAPVTEQPAAAQNQTASNPVPAAPVQPVTSSQSAAPVKKAEVNADDLARLASAFAERFGSFSNQSDYGNIRDLLIFMTDKMKAWADNYIAGERARNTQTAIYYGIVTKAISSEVKSFDADTGLAEILIKTQRRESAGTSGNSSVFYQDISLKYARERGVWRVDGVYWQTR